MKTANKLGNQELRKRRNLDRINRICRIRIQIRILFILFILSKQSVPDFLIS